MSSETRAHKKQSLVQPSLLTSLPDELLVEILARVSRFDYPNISLVSKHFRSMILSSELYARRSLLGCNEACIYAVLFNWEIHEYSLYILRRKANNNRLVLIELLPHMPSGRIFVAVGSKIYVLDSTTDSSSIDCRSHTVQPLPRMPTTPMVSRLADNINGKIYVIGSKGLVVFDTKTQVWEPEVTKLDMEVSDASYFCVGMHDEMYLRNTKGGFVYRPNENKWEIDEMLNSKHWRFACVVDDILYYYDHLKNKLRTYDTKHKCWGVVKGVDEDLPKGNIAWLSHAVSYGGKLALLLSIQEKDSVRIKEIWFVEIAIERREREEIWGKVERRDVVLEFEGDDKMLLMNSLVVMV